MEDLDPDAARQVGFEGDLDVIQKDRRRRILLDDPDDPAIDQPVGPQAATPVIRESLAAHDSGPTSRRNVGEGVQFIPVR